VYWPDVQRARVVYDAPDAAFEFPLTLSQERAVAIAASVKRIVKIRNITQLKAKKKKKGKKESIKKKDPDRFERLSSPDATLSLSSCYS